MQDAHEVHRAVRRRKQVATTSKWVKSCNWVGGSREEIL